MAPSAHTVAWALYRMSRPSQLLAIVIVYALGTLIGAAHGAALAPLAVIGGLGALVPIAVSVHYANEYADHETDALATRTPFSGGSGALPGTGLSPRLALAATVAAGVVGAVATVGGLLSGAFGPLAAGLLAIIAVLGWQYSVGPFRLAWNGLGEVDNALLGGLLLPLYGYAVVRGTVTVEAALACLPFTALVFANLLATTWPDREADGTVGKDTLATRWPTRDLRRAYLAGAAIAIAGPPLLWVAGVLPAAVAAASLLVVPLIAWGARSYTRRRSPLPTVSAMASMAVFQLVAWALAAGVA